jgi:hypothetical protein
MKGMRILALILAGLALAALPGPARTDEPEPGLMWNRTGLPLVFPLDVRTAAGRDYFLIMSDEKTGEDVVAAYFLGGKSARILVPPGTFDLRFAHGETWRGEPEGFGPEGGEFTLSEPLEFGVEGLGVKAGHAVDLRQSDLARGKVNAEITPSRICQVLDSAASSLQPPAAPLTRPRNSQLPSAEQREAERFQLPGIPFWDPGPETTDRAVPPQRRELRERPC